MQKRSLCRNVRVQLSFWLGLGQNNNANAEKMAK